MRLLKGCFTLYTKFTFFVIRVSVIGAILVCLSITLVILEQAEVTLEYRYTVLGWRQSCSLTKSIWSSQKVLNYLGKKTKSGDFTKHCTALSKSMLALGFKRCKSDASIYYYYDKKTKALVITIVYVNDVCFIGTKGSLLLNELKQKFMARQKCHNLGETTEFLGMHISHNCKN